MGGSREKMFNENDLKIASKMFHQGSMPSEILRYFSINNPDEPVPNLMKLIRDAFDLPYEDTQCIGGWWHDGSGELSDSQINEFIMKSISLRNLNT